jgi:hypothetical protein
VPGFVSAEQLVELFFRGIQAGGNDQIALLGFRLFGFEESGADGRGELFDDASRSGSEAWKTASGESKRFSKRADGELRRPGGIFVEDSVERGDEEVGVGHGED